MFATPWLNDSYNTSQTKSNISLFCQITECIHTAYLKSEHSLGDINNGDIHQLSVLSILVVSQEGQDRDDPVRMNQNFQLVTVI